MDPITIGATIASLVTICTKAGMTCNALIGKYKSAPQTLASIQTECTTIKAALSYVYWLINRDTELLSTQLCAQGPFAETLDVALTGCTMTFSLLDSELQKLYDRGDDGQSYGKREKLRYVWDEGLATTILGNMRGLQGAVTLVLTALQTSSLVALNATLASWRPIVEQVRRDTLSICQSHSNVSQLLRGKAESDIYSLFSSTIGDEEFSFDDEIINSQAYRRVMKHWTSKDKATPGDYKQPRTHILDEPLIDLSWPSLAGDSPPTKDRLDSMSHWFGAFEGLPQPLEPTPSSATQVSPDTMVDGGALRGVETQKNGEKQFCSPAFPPKQSNHPKTTTLAAQDRATPTDESSVNIGDKDCSPLKGSHLEAISQSNEMNHSIRQGFGHTRSGDCFSKAPHATRDMAISKTFQSEALYSLTKNNLGNSRTMESVTSPIVSSPGRQAGSNSDDEGFEALAKEPQLITPVHECLWIGEHGKLFNHDGYIVGHVKGSDWKGDESDGFVGKLIDKNGAILDEDGHTIGHASRLSAEETGQNRKGGSNRSPHVSRRPPVHHLHGSGSGSANPILANVVVDTISRLLLDDLHVCKPSHCEHDREPPNDISAAHKPHIPEGRDGDTTTSSNFREAKEVVPSRKTSSRSKLSKGDAFASETATRHRSRSQKISSDTTTSTDVPRLPTTTSSREPIEDKKSRSFNARVNGLPKETKPSRGRGSTSNGLGRGGLTAAALRHGTRHASVSDEKDARPLPRRRSRGFQGQGFSVANRDAKDVFAKHDVAPMPMDSDYFPSELTRCSILTELDEEPESSRHKSKSSNAETGLVKVDPPRNSRSGASHIILDSIENQIRGLILPELKEIKQGQHSRRRFETVDAGPKASYSDKAPDRRKRAPATPPGRRSKTSYPEKAPDRRDRSPVAPPGRGSTNPLVHDIEVWKESRKRLSAKLVSEDITAEGVADGGLTVKALKRHDLELTERLSKVDRKDLPR